MLDQKILTHTDDLHLLVATLPVSLQDALQGLPLEDLVEVVMDLGRVPQARFPHRAVNLREQPVTHEDIQHVLALLGEFSADNRAGIEGTLHRISAIRNRKGQIIGLTLRVGRAVFGTIDLIRDLLESGKSLLFLGRPGVGKTTKLREMARVLADDFGKRVVIVDTSNEIAGDGDVPHPAIGSARRMQVPHPDRQHGVMIEAVENHMPEVIVIDEIGTQEETLAARTIAERGVQLIGTAHGTTLENLVMNPTLSDLVGGVQTVTLSDDEARFRGTQKTVSERKAPPTFDVVVEIQSRDELVVHRDAARAVDAILRGREPQGERRRLGEAFEETPAIAAAPEAKSAREGPMRIYPYALSRDSVERVIRDLHLDARTVPYPEQADLVLALRSRAGDARLQRLLETTDAELHVVKKNTTAQMRRLLQGLVHLFQTEDEEVKEALREAEEAVLRVQEEATVMELAPRPPALRKMQHRLIARHHLVAESVGSEPRRHLIIYPD